MTKAINGDTNEKLRSEKDESLTAAMEMETSKEITVLDTTPNVMWTERDDEYVDVLVKFLYYKVLVVQLHARVGALYACMQLYDYH